MSEKPPADSDATGSGPSGRSGGSGRAGGGRSGGRVHRGAVTSGTAPAVGRGRAVASAQDAEAARRAARAVDRRGALFGLLTAGAAVVVGAAVGGRGVGTRSVTATGRTVEAAISVEGMRFVPDTVTVSPGDRLVITLSNTSDQVHDLVVEV